MSAFALAAALLATVPTANAKSDVQVSIDAPSGHNAYDYQNIAVTVDNTGNRNARSVALTVLLPETQTSPNTYILGFLDAIDSRCTVNGTSLVCGLGRVRKGKSTTVDFDLALPWASVDLNLEALVTTTSSENSTSNNDDLATAEVNYTDRAITGPAAVTNRHCTGQGLTSFLACELSPGSISSHNIVLEANGTVSFVPAQPGYTGVWSQPTPDSLVFEYRYNGAPVANFEGNHVGGDCFEGITDFANGPWMAPYEVCLD